MSLISSHRSHVGETNSSWRDSLNSSKTSMANMHVEKVQSGVQSTELKSGIDSSQSGIRISGYLVALNPGSGYLVALNPGSWYLGSRLAFNPGSKHLNPGFEFQPRMFIFVTDGVPYARAGIVGMFDIALRAK